MNVPLSLDNYSKSTILYISNLAAIGYKPSLRYRQQRARRLNEKTRKGGNDFTIPSAAVIYWSAFLIFCWFPILGEKRRTTVLKASLLSRCFGLMFGV